MPSKDEWSEAEILAEQASLNPLARPAAEGVDAMKMRITSLQKRKAALYPANAPDFVVRAFAKIAAQLDAEIADAQQQLANYQTQAKGMN